MSTVPASPPARTRRPASVRAMLWSIIPLTAGVVLFVVLTQPGRQPVATVDPGPNFAYAGQQLGRVVPRPHGLSDRWRPTSSDVTHPTDAGGARTTLLQVGYLTPDDDYAQLSESPLPTAALVDRVAAHARRDGAVRVGERSWTRYRSPRGETVLVDRRGRVSTLVTGNAALGELQTLARSLR